METDRYGPVKAAMLATVYWARPMPQWRPTATGR